MIRRDEADGVAYNASNQTGGDPHEVWYRFGGRELGYIGNNGTSQLSENDAIADRNAPQGTGGFRNGTSVGTSYADFTESGSAIDSYAQGLSAGD